MPFFCLLYLYLLLGLMMAPGCLAEAPCCSVCECSSQVVWCQQKGLTSVPTDIPTDTRQLYLFDNDISTIPVGSLTKLKNLQLLDLSSNELTSSAIQPGFLSGLTRLSDLNLSDNKLTKIENNTFSGTSNLQRLYIEDNKIKRINNSALENLSNLLELKLSNNLLTSFPKLVACPKLRRLCLSHNRIVRLQDGSLTAVNLEQLSLSHNQIHQLPSTTFRDTSNMRELDLSNNRISRLPRSVSNMSSLHMLNLSGNAIQSIPSNLLENLHRMKTLDLQGLRLTTLPKGFIARRVYLNVFDVSNNPWNCNCELSWLSEYMRAVEGAVPRIDEVKCRTPKALQGHKMVTLYKENLACSSSSATTNPQPENPIHPQRRPTVDLCDGMACANGATCFMNITATGRRPVCRCQPGWKGLLCRKAVKTSTTTTIPTAVSKESQRGKLHVLFETLTSHSIDIIFPTVGKQMTVSTTELLSGGRTGINTNVKVQPIENMYTVKNLQPGIRYNICISSTDFIPGAGERTHGVEDKLCREVTTKSKAMVLSTTTKDVHVVTLQSVGGSEKDVRNVDPSEIVVNTNNGAQSYENGDNSADKVSTSDSQSHMLYAIAGGALLLVVILVVVLGYCAMQKYKKRKRKLSYRTGDSDKGSKTSEESAEMIQMVPQRRFASSSGTQKLLQNGVVYQTTQEHYQSNGQYPQRVSTPNKTESLRRSNSNGSMSGPQPYLDMQRCSPTNSGQKYSSSVTMDEMRSTATPNSLFGIPANAAPMLNSRGQEIIQRTYSRPNHPIESYAENAFQNSDHATLPIHRHPATTTVNQYHQRPIITSTISPQSSYPTINNGNKMPANSYQTTPSVTMSMAHPNTMQFIPNKQMRYQEVQHPANHYDQVGASPHKMNNGIGHVFQDNAPMVM